VHFAIENSRCCRIIYIPWFGVGGGGGDTCLCQKMPMNFAFTRPASLPGPKKRSHPHDMDQYEPAQKVYISEKFANDLAAMSLNHKDESQVVITDHTPVQHGQDQQNGAFYVAPNGTQHSKSSTVVIDDINAFLSDDEDEDDHQNGVSSMDTDFLLPMQKLPGEQKYHVPDFVLQTSRT
jgi:hypothetical protein